MTTRRGRLDGKASWVATLIVLGAMGCALLTGCGRQNVSGTYAGACINETYGGRGMLRLVLNQRGDQLSGTLTISGDLAGGGQISGRIDGNNVTFVTRDMVLGQLTWSGHVKGAEIEGEYFVDTPVATTLLTGVERQSGIWGVSRQ